MMYIMRQASVLLLALCLMTNVFAQNSQLHNFGQILAPQSDAATLNMASDHASLALQHESRQQWTAAMGEYQEIIKQVTAELAEFRESQQNQMLYYVLALANTDYARMLLNMGTSQLFVTDYVQHLTDADTALQKALSLSKGGTVPASQIYAAMAVVKTFQGNYSGAHADLVTLHQVNPNDREAVVAAEKLTTIPLANQDAGASLRMYRLSQKPISTGPAASQPSKPNTLSLPALTENQKMALLHLGEAVASILFPKSLSLAKAGVEVVRAFQTPAQGPAPKGP